MAPARPGQWSGSPLPEITYIDFALKGWRKNPSKTAVVDINSGREVTFSELEQKVIEFAASLQTLGVGAQSRVQFYACNSLDSFVALQAALFCSATVFAFKPAKNTKYPEYKFQTEDAEIEFVLTDSINYDATVHRLLTDPDCRVRKVIIVRGNPQNVIPKDKVLFLDQLPKGKFVPPRNIRIRDDVLFVSYTSGSTGMPKGAMHSHSTLVTSLTLMGIPDISLYREDDRFLILSTLTYASGFIFSSGTLAYGGTIVLASHDIDSDLPVYIEKYKITVFVILECPMKTLIENAHRFPDSERMMSSLRVALIGGTVFPEHLQNEIKKFFGRINFMNVYGMTEAMGLVSSPAPGPELTTHVGFLVPYFEVKILNDKGQPVKVDEPGELLCRGPQMTLGYWKRKTDDFTEDGFYATGDMVTVDSVGNMKIVGRKKYFIICLDERVSPFEIESLLLNHPAVKEIVVVATPHPVVQEAPTAMVVLEPSYGSVDNVEKLRQELIDHVASQVCDSKQLHGGVHFVANLEKTDSGKYARGKITEKAILLSQRSTPWKLPLEKIDL